MPEHIWQLKNGSIEQHLIELSREPVHVDSEVEGPSGGGHPIGATQEGSHCLQHLLKLAPLHLLPCLQTHEGLILGEAPHQGGDLIRDGGVRKDFSRQLWAGGRIQDLQQNAAVD